MSEFNYTYDEVRKMLCFELMKSGTSDAEAQRASEAVTDHALQMWETAGLTSRIDLQERVEKWRAEGK